MAFPMLAVAMIVKNETENLPGCLEALAALRPLVDHVVVYDTGSTDDTREIARSFGARVVEGYWDDDFSRARNEAARHVRARWVLVVDADDRVVADVPRLWSALSTALRKDSARDVLKVDLVDLAPDGTEKFAVHQIRVYRPERACYVGRVHEQVAARRPRTRLSEGILPSEVVHIRHTGYSDVETVVTKAARNLPLAEAEVAELEADLDEFGKPVNTPGLARALFDRGRSLASVGRVAEGRADLDRLVDLETTASERVWGIDILAQMLIAAGEAERVRVLVGQLRAAGVGAGWCTWLEAQALISEKRYAEALPLFRGIDELVDALGRRCTLVEVVEAQVDAAARSGEVDEAVACCIRLMAGLGRVNGKGPLLLALWRDRPVEWLVDLLVGADQGHRDALVAELRGCRAPGPQVAELLRRARQHQPAMSSAEPSS